MIPVRCFTCGKVISSVWEEYKERTGEEAEAGEGRKREREEPGKVLDELGVKRYCCRRMLLTHAELVDEIAPYE
ncbi:DNA-directed RNA polymerase subunit N [ANME-1 cluster archaeon ex4572_4]|nr:DNA-directed RNA polymerase subunit N [Methanophagales archaeon]OYT67394.1 MAG: DNA-directed RNA polymerase subunit N [ANME-1 cluster archaeon ex4572_4]PXF51525.1 MAG: DNA-directed RNA polymerase subunit N [Methanophagales archaeon]HDN68765.1 DNA-directed RNA polymerase subunit N [Methanomicrobia archaeon]